MTLCLRVLRTRRPSLFSFPIFQCVHVYPHSVEAFSPVALEAYATFSHLRLQEWAAFIHLISFDCSCSCPV
jgi:hypothetical protein